MEFEAYLRSQTRMPSPAPEMSRSPAMSMAKMPCWCPWSVLWAVPDRTSHNLT
jgi:hypothetical protein